MALLLPHVERLEAVQVFPAQHHTRQQQQTTTIIDSFAPLTAPRTIPQQIATVDAPSNLDLPYFLPGSGTSVVPFLTTGSSNGTGEIAVPTAPPVPVAPPPVPAAKVTPYRTGGKVQAANLIHQVTPVYPAIAKITHTQGAVILEAQINKDGSIDSLRVLSGSPLLAQAAIDAVKQWRYRPTLLNGEPTDVITTITVTFTLQ
jgi:protein TonB